MNQIYGAHIDRVTVRHRSLQLMHRMNLNGMVTSTTRNFYSYYGFIFFILLGFKSIIIIIIMSVNTKKLIVCYFKCS
jgi:hypothetical protein